MTEEKKLEDFLPNKNGSYYKEYEFQNEVSLINKEEIIACNKLIKKIKKEIENKDKNVKGFNVGTNYGKVAGQSIMHCHIHLIPRRKGDVDNPQGGVRSVIPLKQHYNRKV